MRGFIQSINQDRMNLCINIVLGCITQSLKHVTVTPTDFEITVRNLKVSAGAGFVVALTGEIMTMPGLPKVPAAEKIDVDENGKITGLF